MRCDESASGVVVSHDVWSECVSNDIDCMHVCACAYGPQHDLHILTYFIFTDIDRGVQEWVHFICSQSACRVYVYDQDNRTPKVPKQVFVNLRRTKRVQVPKSEESFVPKNTVVTPDNIVDAYARRKDFSGNFEELLSNDIKLIDFVRKYGYSAHSDSLFLQAEDAIVTIYPRGYSDYRQATKFCEYCKWQLIKYKPWIKEYEDLYNDELALAPLAYLEYLENDASVTMPRRESDLFRLHKYFTHCPTAGDIRSNDPDEDNQPWEKSDTTDIQKVGQHCMTHAPTRLTRVYVQVHYIYHCVCM